MKTLTRRKKMYYEECTPAYAVEFIKEVLENTRTAPQALDFVQQFLDGKITTTEIEDFIY
jgi:hypothetical protein